VSLQDHLIERIHKEGPLTVAEYMAACNAHYYATRDPLGKEGDFTTSPEISQIFGELIGAWMADMWIRMGSPKGILCELGPGRGTLMKDILRATCTSENFHDAIEIQLIEASPMLHAIQKQSLKDAHPRISWHKTLDHLPPLPLFLIANEFFDALPVHQYLKGKGGWQERKVAHGKDGFFWTPDGDVLAEASPDSTDIMARIASHIQTHGGAALIIDYGHAAEEQGDTLQAVRKHTYANPLQNPGEADLTAHVDFRALLHTAKGRGAYPWGTVEQGTFLKRLGAELRAVALCRKATPAQQKTILSGLERLIAPHQMGVLFKVIAISSLPDQPSGF